MKASHKRSWFGFTLIELLTVVAVIGILATLSLGPIRAAQKRGRDAQRKADLNTIAQAIDLYYAEKRRLPGTTALTTCNVTSTSEDGGADWLKEVKPYIVSTKGKTQDIPHDPFDDTSKGQVYKYTYQCPAASGRGYSLSARMENEKDKESTAGVYTIER